MATSTATEKAIQLPLDMVVDILPRLPVKSLKRFRGVSKCWGTLIQSPEFILAHQSFSNSNKVCPLLMHYKKVKEGEEEGKMWVSLINNNNNSTTSTSLDVVGDFVVPPSAAITRSYGEIVGCCNGIVCLWDSHSTNALLWNPATREFKIFPPSRITRNDEGFEYVIGFGYDRKTNDYKLVRLELYHHGHHNNTEEIEAVTLYSLTTNSWTDLDAWNRNCLDFSYYNDIWNITCINEFCHFGVLRDKEGFILSFDFSNQVFMVTPSCPGGTSGGYYFSCVDNGSVLGVLCPSPRRPRPRPSGADAEWYDVWKLGEVGVQDSWTKLYTIGPISYVDWPLGSNTATGEFFFSRTVEGTSKGFIVRHQHPSNQETTTLQPLRYCSRLVMYAESLVSLTPRKCIYCGT